MRSAACLFCLSRSPVTHSAEARSSVEAVLQDIANGVENSSDEECSASIPSTTKPCGHSAEAPPQQEFGISPLASATPLSAIYHNVSSSTLYSPVIYTLQSQAGVSRSTLDAVYLRRSLPRLPTPLPPICRRTRHQRQSRACQRAAPRWSCRHRQAL